MEPGLFENTDLYPYFRPEWINPKKYNEIGFTIDTKYRPFFSPADVIKNNLLIFNFIDLVL